MNNMGCDIMVAYDEDNEADFLIGHNGDFLTTDDIEQKLEDGHPFKGKICLYESIYRLLQTTKGSWRLNTDFGTNIDDYISKNIDDVRFLIKDTISVELRKDDRIKEVSNIIIEMESQSVMIIEIHIIPIGEDEKSVFVYPYSVL